MDWHKADTYAVKDEHAARHIEFAWLHCQDDVWCARLQDVIAKQLMPALRNLSFYNFSVSRGLACCGGAALRIFLVVGMARRTSLTSIPNGAVGRKRQPTTCILRRCVTRQSASMKSVM